MYTSQEGDLYLGQARALGAEGVLPKQIKQSDVTRMLYQLRLVTDRRGEEQTTFRRMSQSPELMPANESAIVVTPPETAPDVASLGNSDVARVLPQMSLEIKAALDGPLQRELAALRSFITASLESQTERLHGDIAALVPAMSPTPVETPTLLPERRNWTAITAVCAALLGGAAAAVMAWMWWQQGAEIAALRNDLSASYAEVEALRARPPVVSLAPAGTEPVVTEGDAGSAGLVPASDLDAAAPVIDAAPVSGTAAAAEAPAAATVNGMATAPAPAAPAAPADSATVVPAAQAQ
jgi:hypothetical protein